MLRHPPRALLHADATPSAARIDEAIAAAVGFLEARQRCDGSLRGFCLYPGASSDWLTAHVCFVVEAVPALTGLARRAAAYLAAHGADDGGWGYNRRVAVDCDSTAQALMVTQRFDLSLPSFIGESLAAAQSDDGGYPTYVPQGAANPAHGWQAPHAEVSAMVLVWLRRGGGHARRATRCEAWLAKQRRAGVLPAYWWNDDAYALWLDARLGDLPAQAAPALAALLGRGLACPQAAMALSAAVALGGFDGACTAAARRLLAMQPPRRRFMAVRAVPAGDRARRIHGVAASARQRGRRQASRVRHRPCGGGPAGVRPQPRARWRSAPSVASAGASRARPPGSGVGALELDHEIAELVADRRFVANDEAGPHGQHAVAEAHAVAALGKTVQLRIGARDGMGDVDQRRPR
ncbi:MAG: hypothetical protein IPM80_09185 [Proteobacteria bacterium]|nr:hypothetical protein [Pseudomonadota bacterium]